MPKLPATASPPRLTAYGLWLLGSRLGGPLLVGLAVADVLRWWWS